MVSSEFAICIPATEADTCAAPAKKLQLREQLLCYGVEYLTDAQLLAIVLGTGHRRLSVLQLARELLAAFGDLQGLARAGSSALGRQEGMGAAKSTRLLASLELGRRLQTLDLSPVRHAMRSLEDVAAWARPRLATLLHEEVWVLGLDGRNGLICARCIARGGMHGCALTPKEVLRPAICEGASAIILVHNHPSGDPTPSSEDISMTSSVGLAAETVGIALVDHVVVARGGSRSINEEVGRQLSTSQIDR